MIKVLLRFRTAFWEEIEHHRYRNGAFFHDPAAAFPTVWTALPVRMPLLAPPPANAGTPDARARQRAGDLPGA